MPLTLSKFLFSISRVIGVLLSLVAAIVAASASNNDTVPHTAWTVCTSSAVCRAAYGLQHQTPDPRTRLATQMRDVGVRMEDVAAMAHTELMASYMALARIAFAEPRCTPGAYERYNARAATFECVCYYDRDCSVSARPVARDTSSPILIGLFTMVVILATGLFISSVVNTRAALTKTK